MIEEYMQVLVGYPFEQVYADLMQFEKVGFFHLAVPGWVTDLMRLSGQAGESGDATVHVMGVEEAVSYGYRYVAHAAMKALGPDVLEKPVL